MSNALLRRLADWTKTTQVAATRRKPATRLISRIVRNTRALDACSKHPPPLARRQAALAVCRAIKLNVDLALQG